MSDPDQRGFTRVPFGHVEAELTLVDGALALGPVSNLSVGGMFVACGPLALGALCRAWLRIGREPGDFGFLVEGKVMRVERDGVGVEFTALPGQSRMHLQNLIQLHADDAAAIEAEIVERKSRGLGR